MLKPDLRQLAHWIDPTLVALLEKRRQQKKECFRHRKLATLETLWLMLALSLDTQRSSLFEILRMATAQFSTSWSVSVAAFCKARSHFSPRLPELVIQEVGGEAASGLQGRTQALVWPASAGH